MTTPTDQPDVLLFGLCLLLYFAFILFPWWFSHGLRKPPGASLVAQRLKRLPPMWETRVQSLGREDPLEKEMATHSSTIAWKIPWTEELGRLQSMGSQRVGHNWATSLLHFRLVTTFLPRSKCLLISWLQSPSAVILEPKKIVCHCFHCFPIYLSWSDGATCHVLHFLNAEFFFFNFILFLNFT